MARTTNIVVGNNGQGIIAGIGTGRAGTWPQSYVQNESTSINLVLVDDVGTPTQLVNVGTFNISVGKSLLGPNRGSFRLLANSTTGSAINYNATTAEVASSVSAILGGVTVTTYGSVLSDGWIVTAATANTALNLTGQSLSLSPATTIDVFTVTTHSTGVTAQKLVKLRRSPDVSVTTYSTAIALNASTMASIGSSTTPSYIVNVSSDAQAFRLPLTFSIAVSGTVTQYATATTLGYFLPNSSDASLLADLPNGTPGVINTTLFGSSAKFANSATFFPNTTTFFENSVTAFYGAITAFFGASVVPYNTSTVNGYIFSLTPKIAGMVTTLSLTATTGVKFALGAITFSGQSLDESFREAVSRTLTTNINITLDDTNGRTSLLQTPLTIIKNIGP